MGEPYTAGYLTTQGRHRLAVNLLRTRIPELQAIMLGRFVEDWCLSECVADWRLEQDPRSFAIFFDSDRDCVLFKLTPEWDYLLGSVK